MKPSPEPLPLDKVVASLVGAVVSAALLSAIGMFVASGYMDIVALNQFGLGTESHVSQTGFAAVLLGVFLLYSCGHCAMVCRRGLKPSLIWLPIAQACMTVLAAIKQTEFATVILVISLICGCALSALVWQPGRRPSLVWLPLAQAFMTVLVAFLIPWLPQARPVIDPLASPGQVEVAVIAVVAAMIGLAVLSIFLTIRAAILAYLARRGTEEKKFLASNEG